MVCMRRCSLSIDGILNEHTEPARLRVFWTEITNDVHELRSRVEMKGDYRVDTCPIRVTAEKLILDRQIWMEVK